VDNPRRQHNNRVHNPPEGIFCCPPLICPTRWIASDHVKIACLHFTLSRFAGSAQIGALGFWRSVWGVEADEMPEVARFEWSIRAYEANFTKMGYLADFTFEGFLDVLNYVSTHWGRLCVPNCEDSNPSRWELAALWSEVRRLIDDWSFNYDGCAKREYDFSPDLKPTYLKAAAGWVAGLMARIGVHEGLDTPVGVGAALQRLEAEGLSINEKAVEKRALFARLAGMRSHE
jgi:hypothetical protein